jgi:hypothetical protein
MRKLLKEKPQSEPDSLAELFGVWKSPPPNTSWVHVPSDPYRTCDPLMMGPDKSVEAKVKKRARR